MSQLFANNAYSALGSSILIGATSLTLASGTGSRFPTPSGGDYFLLTLADTSGGSESAWEIVKVTARSVDILTIERAQEGTTARAWASGVPVDLRITAGSLAGYTTLTGAQTLTNKTFTGYTETQYNLTGTDLVASNGTVQYKTLSGNTTFTESLSDGQGVILMLNPATYTTTWPTTTWIGTAASAAPTLIASVYNCLVFFQMNGTLYGRYVGRV